MRERMRAKDIREFAKEKLKENLKVLVLIQIIIVLITIGITVWGNMFQRLIWFYDIELCDYRFAEMFLVYAFFAGITFAYFMCSVGLKPRVEDVFYVFLKKKKSILWVILRKCIMIQVYAAIFSFFGGLLGAILYVDSSPFILTSSVLAVVIVELRYFPAIYLLIDGEEKEAKKAVWRGTDLMKGNYKRLIFLYLSFIPWMLLGVLTLGIGLFVVAAWLQISMAVFYKDLKEQEKAKTGTAA